MIYQRAVKLRIFYLVQFRPRMSNILGIMRSIISPRQSERGNGGTPLLIVSYDKWGNHLS